METKTLEKLQDDSPMPFGGHEGEEMGVVPDADLLRIWNRYQGEYDEGQCRGKMLQVMDYIADSFTDAQLGR